ncbi:MAG: GGDEF domain-containing protein, partial [Thiovulaceae bacterium]|nr:GGDEF domain-containing protein [Sulfurimonadaceae bacterium]
SAYRGIGIWQDGAWTLQAFLDFTLASTAAVLLLSLGEYNRERTANALALLHAQERHNARKLRELSNRDHLTDLYNRRKLQEVFPQKMENASKKESYFCFFLLDIDYFKQYNDEYGHQKGDEALRNIADILKTTLRRNNDIVFRVGGEEFGGIILGRSKEAIKERLDTVQRDIRGANIEHKTSKAASYLSVSLGAVISHPFEVCHCFDEQFSTADNALYTCKESGRNCSSIVEL